MAVPSFIAASTGGTDATGAWTATCHAPGAADRILIFQLLVDGVLAGAPTISSTTNIKNLAGTAGAWTSIGTFDIGSAAAARQQIYIGRSTGTSAPVITGANTGGDDLYWRFYEFADVNTGTTLADIIENATAGTANNEAGTGTTASDTGVTTIGVDRLALQIAGLNDDVLMSPFQSETGGKWASPVASYVESGGTDANLSLFSARPSVLGNYVIGDTTVSLTGAGGGNDALAQSFTTSGAVTLQAAVMFFGKVGTPTDNLIVEIQTDSAGAPSGTVVSTGGTLAGSALPAAGEYLLPVPIAASLSASTVYHLVLRRSGAGDAVNYYRWRIFSSGSTYAGGTRRVRATGGAWGSAESNDHIFNLIDGSAGTINGGTTSIITAAWGVVGFALIGTTVGAPSAPGPASSRRRKPAHRYMTVR